MKYIKQLKLLGIVLLIALVACFGRYAMKLNAEGKVNSKETEDTSTVKVSLLKGEGTMENPFRIEDMEDFRQFVKEVNGGKSFEGQRVMLITDLDMQETDKVNAIGSGEKAVPFAGIFDGTGHEIQNVTQQGTELAGLFTTLDGMICNLSITGTIQGNTAGALAGIMTERARIWNCETATEVRGDNAGGIAGINHGSIINCVNHYQGEDGTEEIVSNPEEALLWNCYTQKGNCFELVNNTSEEADDKNRQNAVNNLNTMLAELGQVDGAPSWYLWILSAEKEPCLSDKEVNRVIGVSLTEADGTRVSGSYDSERHAWTIPVNTMEDSKNNENDTAWKIQVEMKNGDVQKITCDSGISVIKDNLQEVTYQIELQSNDEKMEGIRPGIIQEQTSIQLETGKIEPAEHLNDKVIIQQIAYVNEKGNVIDQEKQITIRQPGTYTLQGKLKGHLVVDMGNEAITDGNAQAVLRLQQAQRESMHAPGILIKNALETGDMEMPGVKVELADDTENMVSASNSMDIYSMDTKSEGAISTNVTTGFYGTSGLLKVEGDLEGIESKYSVAFQGGNYQIKSADDGVNASNEITINDGTLVCKAGDDALDSNGNISINGGTLIGYTAVEHLLNGVASISGGTVLGASSYENGCKEDSKQEMIELTTDTERYFKKGQTIRMTDNSGATVVAMKLPVDARNLVFSMPGLGGQTYHFEVSNVDSAMTEEDWTDTILTKEQKMEHAKKLMQEQSEDFKVTKNYNQFMLQEMP